MKEVTNELINNFNRRKTDNMKLRHKIHDWFDNDILKYKFVLINGFIGGLIGGWAGAILVLWVQRFLRR